MLTELSQYLRTQQRAALRDLSYRFDIAPEALRGMLDLLEQRGRVRKLPAHTPCGGCTSCDPAQIELYEWVG